jgi:hypothetical protein
MKLKYLFTCFILVILLASFSGEGITNCKCKDIPLYGKVKIVEHHEDFKVRLKTSDADLYVQTVEHHPNECGKWQFVSHHEDFSIRLVEHGEDFSIRYVTSNPGLRRHSF